MATSIRDTAKSVEVATRENREGVTDLRSAIKASEAQFALALPQHVDAGRFLRCALTAINVVPKLAQCTKESVLAGLMQSAQLGLEVADVRGQAYLIPRWDGRDKCMKASFQLGYRGMIDLAARGGITITVDDICANDAFDFERGTNAFLRHKPTLDKRGEVIGYYAVATFADARTPAFVVIGRGEAEEHRDKFASTKTKDGEIYGTWVEHFDAMARKGLALDTPIPTPHGWATMERLSVGSIVFDRHGEQCKVVAVSEVKHKPRCYRLTFGDGGSVVCDDEHIWVAKIGRQGRDQMKPLSIAALCAAKSGGETVTVPVAEALNLAPVVLPIEPWVLGYWLGNGRADAPKLTAHSDDAIEVVSAVQSAGYQVGAVRADPRCHATSISILGLTKRFAAAGLIGHKHVPAEYFRGSIDQRLALLRGLMDSDGSIDKRRGRVSFSSTLPGLRDAVAELARSLGEVVHVGKRQMTGYGKTVTSYEVGWQPERQPFALTRKGAHVRARKVKRYRRVVSIEQIDTVATKCIAVDSPTHTFLAGELMVPTHNTAVRKLLNYLPATVELRTAQAIETTGVDLGPIGHTPTHMGAALDSAVAAIPAHVDPETGEINEPIDTTSTEIDLVGGGSDG